MSKFLKALRVAGDVAEIIVASSIVVEFIERFRAKKKAQVQTVEPAEETDDAAESVSEIVGCAVEATVNAIQEALEKYVEQKESEGEEVFYSLHEFQVIDD